MLKWLETAQTAQTVINETGESIVSMKAHFKTNRNVYVGTGLGVLAGALVVTTLRSRPVTVNNYIAVAPN